MDDGLGKDSGVLEKNRNRSTSEFIATVETGNLKDEEVTYYLTLELCYQLLSCLGRTT